MRFPTVLLAAAAVAPAQSPLSTTFAANNAHDGNMFDVVATGPGGVTIHFFEVHCDSGLHDFEVYTRAGSYAAHANNAAAWTLVGAADAVAGNGIGVSTTLPICVDVHVAPGATQAFYVTCTDDAFALLYTNGTAVGAVAAQNADLQLLEGAALRYPFQGNFSPRIWNGRVHYVAGNGPNCPRFATATAYGGGCGEQAYASAYELLSPFAMDLDGMVLRATDTGVGLLLQAAPGAGGVAPGANATPLPTGDDIEIDTSLYGGTLGLFVGSNGWVARGPGNSTGFAPDVGELLGNPAEGVYAWTDLQPTAAGSGGVFYEEVGSRAIVTYDGVFGWGTTGANTLQITWDTAAGDWSIEFDGVAASNPEPWLVGYSQAGASLDGGRVDLSALVTQPVLTSAVDRAALALAAERPKLGGGWQLSTRFVDPMSPIGVTFFGVRGPAVSAAALGIDAPGCDLHLASLFGSLSATNVGSEFTVSLPIPNLPVLAGAAMAAQSICLSQQNPALLLFSNGVEGTFGS